jgi:hypothetical protein
MKTLLENIFRGCEIFETLHVDRGERNMHIEI